MSVAAPSVASALVVGVRPLGGYSVVALQAPHIARETRPGQFVMISLEHDSEHILSRPFSVYRADPDTGVIEIAFDVIGAGTRWIAEQRSCTELRVTGPLGTPFAITEGVRRALLVGGGYGASALYELAVQLKRTGCETHLIAGAATARRVFAPDEHLFDAVTVTTQDGSRGMRGLVTDAMREKISAQTVDAVYACGPMAMLGAVSRLCVEASIPVQVATEEFMACGVGVCWTCVVPVNTSDGVRNMRCCTEGPVFDGAEVQWR